MVHCGFSTFQVKEIHFQPQIWSIWPIFPNDSESLPKVCYIKRKNSEILSKLRNSEPVGVSASLIQKEKYHQIKPNSDKQIPTQIFASFANRSREKMGISSFLHLLSPNPNWLREFKELNLISSTEINSRNWDSFSQQN